MRKPVGRAGLTTFSTVRDILLLIIGLNTLVFLALAQPGRGMEALVGTVGIVTLLIGVYRTACEMISRP
jgi:hypothetical protein